MGRNKIKKEGESAYQLATWLNQEEVIALRKLALEHGYNSFVQYITVALRTLIKKV